MKETERLSWELGWDHARFRWPAPSESDAAFEEGYRAFKHGRSQPKKPSIFEKKWLQLRWNAHRRGKTFDPIITPDFIKSLLPLNGCCPVTNQKLTFATKHDTDWSVERACNDEGYVPGNLIVISVKANAAKSNYRYSRICEFADGRLANDRLSQKEWQRLAELVEPMNCDNVDGFQAVDYCRGQRIAPGTLVTPLVRFQALIASVAIQEASDGHPALCKVVFAALESGLCRTKKEARAFRKLILAVRQRATHIHKPDRLWATTKVHKKMEVLLNALGSKEIMERIHTATEQMPERAEGHPLVHALRSLSEGRETAAR